MLATILITYFIIGAIYWLIQGSIRLPKAIALLIMLPVLPFVLLWGMVRSLPDYLKKDGKYYRYRWAVYFTFFSLVLLIVALILPADYPA